jgi:cell division protein FtsN
VASFRESERAEKVYWSLWFKGYTVAVEKSESGGEDWHRVLVGKFPSEREAEALVKTLQEREGFANMMIRRRSAEKSE